MFKSASEHDLLFDLLASWNGPVNQVQPVEAFQDWTLEQGLPARSLSRALKKSSARGMDDGSARLA
jgi:hypothetical protein